MTVRKTKVPSGKKYYVLIDAGITLRASSPEKAREEAQRLEKEGRLIAHPGFVIADIPNDYDVMEEEEETQT